MLGPPRAEQTLEKSATWPVAIGGPVLVAVAVGLHFRPPVTRFSIAGFLAITLSALLAVAVLRGRWGTVHRSGLTAAVLVAVGCLPACAFACTLILRKALWSVTFDRSNELIAGLGGLVGGLFVLGFTPVVASHAHRRLVDEPGGDRVVRAAAWGSVILAAVLGVYAFSLRARAEPDDFFPSFPVVGPLVEDAPLAVGPRTLRYVRLDKVPPDAWQKGGRRPHFSSCRVEGLEPPLTTQDLRDACQPLVAALDPHSVYGLVREPDGFVKTVFRLDEGKSLELLTTRMLRGRLKPPSGWTLGLLGSTTIALGLLLVAAIDRARARRIAGVAGHHEGSGMILIPDVGSLRVEEATRLPIGPVLVARVHNPEADGAYRSGTALSMSGISAGTLEDQRAPFLDKAFSLESAALAAAWLGLTPMLVAAAFGLL